MSLAQYDPADYEGFFARLTAGMRRARAAVLRYWNVVRPGWPVPALSLLACILLFGSTQGREALHVVGRPENNQFLWTFAILVIASIVQYGVFLIAVCGYYKTFSDRAYHGAGVRLVSAALVGLIVPAAVFGFFLFAEGFHGVDLSKPSAAVLALVVLIVLAVAGVWHIRRRIRLQLSPFSAIVRVGPGFITALCVLSLGGAVLLIAAALDIELARDIGPVGLTLLGTTLWSVLWTGAAAFVERTGLPPTPVIALILAVLVSLVGPWTTEYAQEKLRFDRNLLDTAPRDANAAPLMRAETYAREWLSERVRGARGAPVRAVVVIAEGGGIRAAVQTAALLEELDRHGLYCDLFAVSGVSGGAVGIANYLADRGRAEGAGGAARCTGRSVNAVSSLREDHLSPLLANMYAWDWPMAFVPVPTRVLGWNNELHDRARAFESSLSHGDAALMSRPFLEVVQGARQGDRAWGPMVLLNTTRTADGAGEVVSNVTFLRGAQNAELDQRATERLCNVLERLPADQTLSMATAAHLSARFPFVSPPGALRTGPACGPGAGDVLLRYVDGGYLDNSGALTASQAVAELERVRGGVPVEYVVIHVYTQAIGVQALRSNELLPEVTGPLDAVVGARNLQGLGPSINLCRQVQGLRGGSDNGECDRRARQRTVDPCSVEPCAPSIPDDYILRTEGAASPYWISAPLWASSDATDDEFVPLGWVLSQRSADYVDGQMRSVGGQIAEILAQPSASP